MKPPPYYRGNIGTLARTPEEIAARDAKAENIHSASRTPAIGAINEHTCSPEERARIADGIAESCGWADRVQMRHAVLSLLGGKP